MRKKTGVIVVTGILMITILAACGSNKSNNKKTTKSDKSEKITTEKIIETTVDESTEEETTAKSADDRWKKAYTDYINDEFSASAYDEFNLIYVNDDDIPELVAIGDCEAAGCRVCTYYEGKVNEVVLDRLSFSYIERENMLCNSGGNMDVYFDTIYSIEDGEFTKQYSGQYGAEDNTNVEFDANDEPIYTYKWNGKSVTKDEYSDEFGKVYNTDKSVEGYEYQHTYSMTEVLDLLKNSIMPSNQEIKAAGYTDDELAEMAMAYYERHNDYKPGHSAVDSISEDGSVTIQLYDSFSDHNSTCAWYVVDRETATGTNSITGEKIDLNK